MKRFAVVTLAALAVLASPVVQAKEKLTGEQKLAKLLKGREAGEPVSCIPLFESRDVKVIDKTALVFGTGRTIYVNRPKFPESIDSSDILVTKTSMSQLCRLDSVQMRDRVSLMYSGFVALEDFIPYRKVDKK